MAKKNQKKQTPSLPKVSLPKVDLAGMVAGVKE